MVTNRTRTWGLVPLFAILLSYPIRIWAQSSVNSQQRFERAVAQISQHNYEQAIPALQAIITQEPQFSRAYRILVESSIFVGKRDEARAFFDGIVTEQPQNAYAHYALGRLDFLDKQYDQAIAHLKTSIEFDPVYVDAYNYRDGLPEVYRASKNLESGLIYFRGLVAAQPENPCVHYGLARIYMRKYEWDKAWQALSRALQLDPEFGLVYHSMIYISRRTGKSARVLELSQQLVRIAERTGDGEMLAYANMMLGLWYKGQGDFMPAMRFLTEALKNARLIGDRRREGTCLNNLAIVYALSGNYHKARLYLNRAFDLAKASGSIRGQIFVLINIGNLHRDQQVYDEALRNYQRALAMARRSQAKREEGIILSRMGRVLNELGDTDTALANLGQSLEIARQTKDKTREGFVLYYLGNLSNDAGRFEAASEYHRQAIEIGRASRNTEITWVAEAGMGASLQALGRFGDAVDHYERAIALYDSVREGLDIESLRNNFLEDRNRAAYPPMVQLLAQGGQIEKAFTYAEKYKAKTILDVMSQRPFLFADTMSDSLSAKLQEIRSQYENAHHALSVESARLEKNADKVLQLNEEITDLELQKAAIIADIRRANPRKHSLASPEVLDIRQIQSRVLRRGQALIEYVVGAKTTSIFVITPDTVIYSQVAAGRQQWQRKLSALSPIFGVRTDRSSGSNQRSISAATADFKVQPAFELYETLFKPLEDYLHNVDEIIIVPDDMLFYLPFELLVTDTSKVETPYDFGSAHYLLEKYAISYVSAASLLNLALKKHGKPPKDLLAIGNPSFAGSEKESVTGPLLTSKEALPADNNQQQNLAALPNAELEVKAISEAMAGASNSVRVGAVATEAGFKRDARDFGLLHFATHFLVNDKQPMYSRLALAPDDQGKEDGFLETYEVFDLDLNADLAVLSACETGLGNLRKGEGFIGVSRAFLFAGTPSLVVSLWSVDDESTSRIMKYFYENLRKGLPKNKALRLAKLEYLKSTSSLGKDPYYWAPFVLLGNSEPLQFSSSFGWRFPTAIVLSLTIAIAFFIRKRRVPSKLPN